MRRQTPIANHSARLQEDLNSIRLLIESHKDSDQLQIELQSIAVTQATNLAKAKDCERSYTSIADANDYLAGQVKLFEDASGLSLADLDWRQPDQISEAARQHIESLETIRDLFDRQCLADTPDTKELKRLSAMLIRSEKLLWKELLESEAIVSQERLIAIFKSFTDRLIAYAKPLVSGDSRWGEIVDQVLNQSGYQSETPEPCQP
jgi:hypothetical protein